MMNWITVYVTSSMGEAHIVQGRLEHEGIPAFIHYAAGRSALGITIGQLGEIMVGVHPEDYDHAMAVLEPDGLALPRSELNEEESETDDDQ